MTGRMEQFRSREGVPDGSVLRPIGQPAAVDQGVQPVIGAAREGVVFGAEQRRVPDTRVLPPQRVRDGQAVALPQERPEVHVNVAQQPGMRAQPGENASESAIGIRFRELTARNQATIRDFDPEVGVRARIQLTSDLQADRRARQLAMQLRANMLGELGLAAYPVIKTDEEGNIPDGFVPKDKLADVNVDPGVILQDNNPETGEITQIKEFTRDSDGAKIAFIVVFIETPDGLGYYPSVMQLLPHKEAEYFRRNAEATE